MKQIVSICLGLPLLGWLLAGSPAPPAPREGIAARYPHDIGLERDPDVLFVERFEGSLDSIVSRYSDVVNREGMSLDDDMPAGARGGHALKITNMGGVNEGGHLFRRFEKGFDSVVYLRYYVRYPSSSKGYIHHESVWFGGYHPATPWPSPRAGTCGLGDQRIAVGYEPVGQDNMDAYLYWGGMHSFNGGRTCYGNDLVNGGPGARAVDWDRWTCVEVMVKLNDPVTASNGELRIWQDGVEVGHWGPGFPRGRWNKDSWFNEADGEPFEGFQWRTDPALNINYLWIEFYDDKSPSGASHHIHFSNIVLARHYIGPIAGG